MITEWFKYKVNIYYYVIFMKIENNQNFDKVVRILENTCVIGRCRLLQKSHLKAHELDECVDYLIDNEMLHVDQVKNDGRKIKTSYIYNLKGNVHRAIDDQKRILNVTDVAILLNKTNPKIHEMIDKGNFKIVYTQRGKIGILRTSVLV